MDGIRPERRRRPSVDSLLAWSGKYEERLGVYVREHPQHEHGRHSYGSGDFGLTDDAIAERFTEYGDVFGLTPA